MHFKLLLLIDAARDKGNAAHWSQLLPKQHQLYYVMGPQVLICFYGISGDT